MHFLVLEIAQAAEKTFVDPLKLYGDKIVFDVFRRGEQIGHHVVRFNRTGHELLVSSRLDLSIDVFFITVYRFLYESKAIWRLGVVNQINVEIDDNGEPFRFQALQRGGVLRIQSERERAEFAGPLLPTNHWNAKVLDANRVLNTLTGDVHEVRIVSDGRELVATERGNVVATKYAYSGEFETEVWYDEQGRWVKMRFDGEDGVPIEYVCQRCQGPELKPPLQ
tara:strand:- start:85 stop:753 length:669 start_codon:yes stop_codon:yes gene_type:complete